MHTKLKTKEKNGDFAWDCLEYGKAGEKWFPHSVMSGDPWHSISLIYLTMLYLFVEIKSKPVDLCVLLCIYAIPY